MDSRDKRNLFLRLYSGDVPLPVTYWVFGVLIGMVGGYGFVSVLEANRLALSMTPLGRFAFNVLRWVPMAYSFFIILVVWRSAAKYKGHEIWKTLARVAVFFALLSNILAILEVAVSKTDSVSQHQMLNEGLPRMIDHRTRLDSVTITRKELEYHYTVLGIEADAVDVAQAGIAQEQIAPRVACNDSTGRIWLNEGGTITYKYQDSKGKTLTRTTVSRTDCGEP